jgi:NADH-quinone oxidoreductase subunit L
MVAAGVYLVGRLFPIFEATDHALVVVAYVGAITAVLGGTMGMVMHDIKRVLAYSTISQLGYMMLALGVFGYIAAFFHLMTHAFFKALLFLGSGSVNHATNTFDMREMGGLWRFMPLTFTTFVIGALSLAGVFPLAGFWSKDEILRAASEEDVVLYVAAMAVVFMTAFYMFRAVSLTFLGAYRGGGEPVAHGAAAHGHDAHDADALEPAQTEPLDAPHHAARAHRPHESSWIMTAPLVILAVPAIVAGLANAGDRFFGVPLAELLNGALPAFARAELHEHFNWSVAIISSALALLGIVSALAIYGFGARWQVGLGPLRPVYRLVSNKYFLDDLYERGIAAGLTYGVVTGLASLLDNRVVDGIVNGAAWVARRVAAGLARVQNGQEQAYGLVFLGGLVILAIVMFAVTG